MNLNRFVFAVEIAKVAAAPRLSSGVESRYVLSVDIKNWDKHQICIKSKFKNIHCVNLAFYK
jgi:hypothetical protein